MKTTEAAPKRGGPSWSHQLQQRYGLRLDASLADWFDSHGWQRQGLGEFNQTVSPDALLADIPEVLWPGLMLPDTLPVLGNRYGDWLCVRVGHDSTITEIVHWYHGGGDWIPWGKTLAEAILFDTIRDALPGRWQGHAVPAEPRRPADSSGELVQWAAGWLPAAIRSSISRLDSNRAADLLLEHHISEAALRCELSLAALDSGLRRILSPEIAAEMEIPWEPDAVSWLFDTSLVDAKCRRRLSDAVGAPIDFEQDWATAAKHATAICQQRSDLGWAFDVAGWAAERQHDAARAADLYRRGSMALAFADQSIRFRTHWFPQAKGKFSLWRLERLGGSGSTSSASPLTPVEADGRTTPHTKTPAPPCDTASRQVEGYLEVISRSNSRTLRARVSEYWQTIAERAAAEGRAAEAYDAHYRAGWDLGLDDLGEYPQRLQSLVTSAEQAGQTGRARLAQAHLDAFRQRFG